MGKWDELDPLYDEFRADKKPKKIKKDRRKLKFKKKRKEGKKYE